MLGTPGDRYLVAVLAGGHNSDGRPGAHADLDLALPQSTGGDGRADRIHEAIGFCRRDRAKNLQLVEHTGILARVHDYGGRAAAISWL